MVEKLPASKHCLLQKNPDKFCDELTNTLKYRTCEQVGFCPRIWYNVGAPREWLDEARQETGSLL